MLTSTERGLGVRTFSSVSGEDKFWFAAHRDARLSFTLQ